MTFFKWHFKNDRVNLKKMMKNDKNNERVLLYQFLNNENHTQLVSLGRKSLFNRMCQNMNEWEQLLLYLYLCILEGKNVC